MTSKRRTCGILSAALFILVSANASTSFAVVNGTPVRDASYVQVSRFWLDEMACSGTLIGPRVFITAAHCLMPFGLQTRGSLEIGDASLPAHQVIKLEKTYMIPSPYYNGAAGDSPDDLAIGILPQAVRGIEPISIETNEPPPGTSVALVGWGDKGWNFTTLRAGENRVRGYPDGFMETEPVNGNGVMCQGGDSGGAVLIERGGKNRLVGVILGNGADVSAATSLSSPHSLEFLHQVANEKHLKICGINSDCENSR